MKITIITTSKNLKRDFGRVVAENYPDYKFKNNDVLDNIIQDIETSYFINL